MVIGKPSHSTVIKPQLIAALFTQLYRPEAECTVYKLFIVWYIMQVCIQCPLFFVRCNNDEIIKSKNKTERL